MHSNPKYQMQTTISNLRRRVVSTAWGWHWMSTRRKTLATVVEGLPCNNKPQIYWNGILEASRENKRYTTMANFRSMRIELRRLLNVVVWRRATSASTQMRLSVELKWLCIGWQTRGISLDYELWQSLYLSEMPFTLDCLLRCCKLPRNIDAPREKCDGLFIPSCTLPSPCHSMLSTSLPASCRFPQK